MNEIRLKNYRCFREDQTARLAPLTLLVGENSTGKTSFMAMIRALHDVAFRQRVPDFKEDPYDLGSFDDIAHYRGGRGGRADTFETGFDFTRGSNGRKNATEKRQSFDFKVVFRKKATAPVLVRARLSSEDVWIEHGFPEDQSWQSSFGTRNGAWKREVPAIYRYRLDADDDLMLPLFLYPSGYPLKRSGDGDDDAEFFRICGAQSPTHNDLKQVEELLFASEFGVFGHPKERPYASAPVRSKPRRTYDPARPTRDPEGDYVPMYLANLHFQDKQQWETLKGTLESFGQEAGLFDEISVKPLGSKDSGPFQVQVRKFGSRARGPQPGLIFVRASNWRRVHTTY